MTSLLAPAALDPRYGSDEPDGVFPRTVRHFGGETLVVEPPTRTVAISTGNLDASVALGVIPAGSTHNDSGGFLPAYLRDSPYRHTPDADRDLDDVVDLGLRTAPDLDRIAALHPTLITASFRGYGSKAFAELSRLGPAVLPEGKGFNWKTDLLIVASALGRTERALALLQRYAARAETVAAHYRDAGSPVISVVRFGPLGLETHGTWSFCGSVLSDVGARRPPEQSRHDNGTRGEATTALDADLLFYTRVDAGADAWAAAAPVWSTLSAVAGGTAREVDAASWHGHAGIMAAMAVLDEVDRHLAPRA